ncbi:MAG: hypothetical protein A3K40_06800 [Syntrophobacterales bacterium RIFOXYC2_FULL_60_23]|nr:MAG: hypothetical protein A3K40_06800 [Syntrophobacterales bacterium RIFOXYC2_FULL_60_23]
MTYKCFTPRMKIPPTPLFERGVLKSPFGKGGFGVSRQSLRLPKEIFEGNAVSIPQLQKIANLV